MNILATDIAGAFQIETQPYIDHRGAFARMYCEKTLAPVIGNRRIVQINHSRTTEIGALRGLHFQHSPYGEMKMVSCVRGRVWDVLVDLRSGSSTFLQWHAQELSPHDARMIVIPEGCAHGFQVLERDSELIYFHTSFYEPSAEAGVSYKDPRLGITWPIPVTDLSERDMHHPLLSNNFTGLHV
jgi:dTDP-4-dehydrorhamnose 3,5-epimerase